MDQEVIAECDTDGIVTALRGPVLELFGYHPEEVLGREVVTFLHPRNRDIAHPVITALVGNPHLELWDEVRVQLPDGSWRWVEVSVRGGATNPVEVVLRPIAGAVASTLDARRPSDALAESERRFRQLAEAAPIGVFQEERGVGVVYVNRRWQEITGIGRRDALGHGWQRILHPDDAPALAAGAEAGAEFESLHSYGLEQTQFRIQRPDGSVRWVEIGTAPVADEHGTVTSMVGTIDDITESVEANHHATRLSHVIEATSDLVGLYDFDDGRLYVNEATRRFLGLGDHSDLPTLHAALPDWMVTGWPDDVLPHLMADGLWSGEIELVDHTGRAVPMSALMLGRLDADGTLLGVSAVLRDLSERKALEERLEHQATHDPLTDLPNRVLLLDRLEVALGRAGRTGTPLAVLFLDLDRFKVVNDSLGHALGDQVLVALAERIEAAVRPGDTVARFGGDEFVVLVEDLDDETEVVRLARRLAAVVGAPVEAEDELIVVSASIGIAISGGSDETPGTLLRDADAAMYRAKAQGPSRHEIFDAAMRTEVVDRLDLESALRRAVAEDQLVLHYQPKVDLASGRIVGFEALVRWQHPTRGLLLPDDFLPIAEETGLILEIGAWVFDRSVAALVELDAATPEDHPPLYLCVNLSATELDDPGIVDTVRQIIERHGIRADHLDIEITEHTLMRDVDRANRALRQLKELGIMVAVDDFGTGYSSLAYLRTFPVDLLKIDRTFVAGLGGEKPEDAAIVTAVATLAGSLGLAVVAEGVETAAQLAELRRIGCSMAQGWFIGRPTPLAEAVALAAAAPTW